MPEFAVDANGQQTPYFISTTPLEDRRFAANDPRRYVDGRTIPHFVLPGGEGGPFTTQRGVRLGDLALLVADGRGVFAVFAEGGPAGALGEASPAAINRLRGQPDSMTRLPRAMDARVTTLILPGSHTHFGEIPRSARAIADAGRQALSAAGGLSAFRNRSGLNGPISIAAE